MTAKLYDHWTNVPEEISKLMKFDETKCELEICCTHRYPIGGHLHTDAEGVDVESWNSFGVLSVKGDSLPVLCCEDCFGFVETAFKEN